MRHAVLVAVCVAFLVAPLATSRAEPPRATPYDGYLPNPEWTESDPYVPYHAVRVVDAESGKPIAGASLRGYEEDIHAATIEYAPLLRESRSDADGIAWVPAFPEQLLIDHWVVEADGYAPAYEYGYQPPAVVRLVRGVPLRGRIADVHGVPICDLDVEAFCGCPHGPVVGRTRTDGEGRFALPPFAPEALTTLWFVTTRGASAMVSAESVLFDAACDLPTRLAAGRVVKGRVVDAAGKGIAGVVIRAYGALPPPPREDPGFVRGPGTRTDTEGRFSLAGMPARGESAGLLVTLPGSDEPLHWRVPNLPEPVMRLVVPQPDPGDRSPGWLVLRPVDEDGRPVEDLPYAIAVSEDGREQEDLAVTPGFAHELPPGTFTVAPQSAFSEASFEPFTVEIASGRKTERDVVVAAQPKAELLSEGPPLEGQRQFTLASDHETVEVTLDELRAGEVFVPGKGTVSLDVDGSAFRFEPAQDDRRKVTVRLPRPKVVILVAPFEIDDVALTRDGLELEWPELEGSRFETDFKSKVVALVRDADGNIWRVPLDLTGSTESRETWTRTVDVAKVGDPPVRGGPLRLTWRFPDGSVPEEVDLFADGMPGQVESIEAYGATPPEEELMAPCHVRLRGDGLQPIEADLEPGERELVFGPCTLVLEAFGPGGERTQSVVMVSGHLHRDYGEEPFRLRGLEKGRHRVIVTPFDLSQRGVVMELDLTEAETRHEVRFTNR